MSGTRQRLLNIEQGGRRQSRLRVQLPAVVTTRDGTRHVTLDDLSIRGARLVGGGPHQIGQQVVVQWVRYEAFGEVRWLHDGRCGVSFYQALPVGDLIATREVDEAGRRPVERELVSRTAEAFVNGRLKL